MFQAGSQTLTKQYTAGTRGTMRKNKAAAFHPAAFWIAREKELAMRYNKWEARNRPSSTLNPLA